jgi:signal transduction histidine kinase
MTSARRFDTRRYPELLQRQASSALDELSSRYLQMILSSSKRIGNLIDDLPAFSRLGREETRMTAVDLGATGKRPALFVRTGLSFEGEPCAVLQRNPSSMGYPRY